MNRGYFFSIVAYAVMSNGVSAQWGPAPAQSQWAQPSNSSCNASFSIPEANIEVPITYQGTCPRGFAEGYQTVRELADDENQGLTVTITSTFVSGRPTGQTTISLPGIFSFDGQIENNIMRGKFTFVDFSSDGEYRNGQIYTGRVFRAKSMGGGINHFVAGELVSTEAYNAALDTINRPSPAPQPQIAVSTETPILASIKVDGKPCNINLPQDKYRVEIELGGKCVDGFYQGNASLTLTPKTLKGYPPAKMDIRFERGLPVGQVKAHYRENAEVFTGTLLSWIPSDGKSEKSLGNRNYQITIWQGGQPVSKTVEYRPPSELELALVRTVSTVAERGVDCVVGQCAQERKAEKRAIRQAQAANNYQQIANGGWQPGQSQWGGSSEGQPAPAPSIVTPAPAQVAGNEQQPSPTIVDTAPTIATSPPASNNGWQPGQSQWGNGYVWGNQPSAPTPTITTSPPELGGNTNPPVVTTQPPDLPAPHPTAPTLPEPVRGVEPLALPVPAPVQVASLPDPITPQPIVAPPPLAPPVQLGNGNDTLGTGPAPSNPAPPPEPLGNPITPSQLVAPATSPPVATPANTGSSSPVSQARPNAPVETYPGYTTEQSAVVFSDSTPTFGWSGVTGATYYQVATRNLGTGMLEINEPVRSTSFTPSRPLSQGQMFRWNVMACNGSGCSAPSGSKYFRTGGIDTTSSQCGQLTRYEQPIIDGYYGLPQQAGVSKPTQSTLCRWRTDGSLQAHLDQMRREIATLANSGPNAPASVRHQMAVQRVRNSADIQKKIEGLAASVANDAVQAGVKNKLALTAGNLADAWKNDLGEIYDMYKRDKSNPNWTDKALLTKMLYERLYQKIFERAGVPAARYIPQITDISGTAAYEYLETYVSGN